MKHDWFISWVGSVIGLTLSDAHQILSLIVLTGTGVFTAFRFIHWNKNKNKKNPEDERPF